MLLEVLVTCAVHVFTVFAFTFALVSALIGWLVPLLYCLYVSYAIVIVAVVALLTFRKRPPKQGQRQAFIGASWPPVNIGHRGCASDAPENTIVSFREACKNGAQFVEFDVALSKDGVPVIIHDDTVDRTTDGNGDIHNFTLAELSKLNAAAKHPLRNRFPQATIPTLEDATMECLNLGLNIFFDVKDWSTKMVKELVELYKRHPELYERGIVCSFYPMVSYRVRYADSGIMTALTTCNNMVQCCFGCEDSGPYLKRFLCILGDYLLLWSQASWLWILCGNMATLLSKDMVTRDTVTYWQERGIATVVWTVNDNKEKAYFHQALQCGVITDTIEFPGTSL